MKIELANLAHKDLKDIQDYISQDNPSAAQSVVKRVLEAIQNLAAFPTIGRPGRVPRTRELVISGTPFIAVYQVRQETLFIVRIIHGARKWPPVPQLTSKKDSTSRIMQNATAIEK